MLTLAEDHENLRAKLVSLGYNGDHIDDESLVQALVAVYLTLGTLELSEAARGTILDLLSASGRTSVDAFPTVTEEDWENFSYGNVKFGDFVRVKRDAYDSPSGARHNGLVGVLTAMRGGQCTVKYLGLAAGNTQPHPMENLDSLKGVYNRRLSQN